MMNVRSLLTRSVVLLAALFSFNTFAETAEQDPAAVAADEAIKLGIQLYYMKGCYACHGPQGEGVLPKDSPRLAGLSAEYLTRQLQHFRDGVRGAEFDDVYGRQMPMPANSLTDDHIGLLANFIATLQPRIVADQRDMGGDTDRGKTLYDARCASCHGVDATGNTALSSPRLSGQQNAYMARQIRNYKSGVRGAHADDIQGKQMLSMANLLTSEQDIVDVSVYLGSIGKPEPVEANTAATDILSVVRNFYGRLDSGDKQVIFDVLDADVVFHFPGQEARGPYGYWGFVSQGGAYMPDYKHILEDLSISEEDETIVEVGFINLVGTTAVGVAMEFPGSAKYRVVDGRIVEAWVEAN